MLGSAVRARLLMREPFWGSILMNLELVEDASIETLAVNNVRLRYNPAYLESLTEMEREGVFAHEAGHIMLGHIWRRNNRDLSKWNEAADYALNPLLLDSMFILPKNVLDGAAYRGMSAEAIYSKRQAGEKQDGSGNGGEKDDNSDANGKQSPGDDQQADADQSRAGSDQGAEGAQSDAEGAQSDEGDQGGSSPDQGDECAVEAASATGDGSTGGGKPQNNPMPGCPTGGFEDAVAEPGEDDVPPMSEQDWQIAIEQAVKVAQAAGKLPGCVAQAIIETRESKVDWVSETREFIARNLPSGQSWASPNRRHVHAGLYLPGTTKENVGTLVLAVDASGSTMWLQQAFANEFGGLINEARPERIFVVYWDTTIKSVDEYTPDDFDIKYKPSGFGGTIPQCAFDYIEEQMLDPLAIIVLTDMEWSEPKDPGIPVLWVAPDYAKKAVSFGQFVGIPCV